MLPGLSGFCVGADIDHTEQIGDRVDIAAACEGEPVNALWQWRKFCIVPAVG
jgi:hypothetical protein